MIKCRFVDIKDISSDLPRSNFFESDLEQLANLILATDGLIRPLIIKKAGADAYTVIEGHREYYAALKAKEQNSSKVEMVNAFVINAKIQSSAIEQLKLIKEDSSMVVTSANTSSGIEQIMPTLRTAISDQIQPLVEQLAEQKNMLEALLLNRTNSSTVRVETIKPPDISKIKDPSPVEPVKVIEIAKVVEPKPPKPAKLEEKEKSQLDTATKDNTSKKVAVLPELISPINTTNPLNLINTLSQNELVLAMERSGVSKAAIKLVPKIITIRASQPDQKFDTWETITGAKITGLGPAKVKEIIEKLK